MITSFHNERIKLLRVLQSQPRIRRKEGLLVLEGVRLISDALAAGYLPTFVIFTRDAVARGGERPGEALYQALLAKDVLCLETTPEVLNHAADTQSPQGMIAVLPMPTMPLPSPNKLSLVLILDAVADPGNLGTILRAAAASGADAVMLAPGCVDPYNPKALRSGMGAHFRIPLIQAPWSDIASQVAHMTVYLADSEGTPEYTVVNWAKPAAVIIGGEARGADQTARQLARDMISIPMANQAESLNAAIAAAVILFEIRRQRSLPKAVKS